eukprot:5775638-Amphidinium_carterae.1
MKAIGSQSKQASEYMVNQLIKFVNQLGYTTIQLRCDHEPATIALQERVQANRLPLRTILSTGKPRDSQ